MELVICQSCSMPLEPEKEELFWTEADWSKSADYCVYCYKDGAFIFEPDMTLEEAIADSVNYAEYAGLTKEEMLERSKVLLPTLKRWKKG